MLKSVLKRALGLGAAVVEGARAEGESMIVSAGPRRAATRRPARAEAVNNKVRVAVRQGCGFRSIDDLAALVMLRRSDLGPALPGGAAA